MGQFSALLDISERTPKKFDDRPGYWSEFTTSSVLWRMYKSHNSDLKPIWNTMTRLKSEGSFVYLIEACDTFIENFHEEYTAMANLLNDYAIKYSPATRPSVASPFPTELLLGAIVQGSVNGLAETAPDAAVGAYNHLSSSAFFAFSTTKVLQVTLDLTVTSSQDPTKADLSLYLLNRDGETVEVSDRHIGVNGKQRIVTTLDPGRYIIEVRGWRYISATEIPVYAGNFTLKTASKLAQ